MNIYLIGFMGSGKSTAGKSIAALLQWKFADIDKLVEENAGMTVPEIFAAGGEDSFRMAEKKALTDVSHRTRTVVACGGGTPCSAENMEILKSTGVTVYLKVPAEVLVSRLRRSRNHRPLLSDADPDELNQRVLKMLESRATWYEQADLVIDGEQMTDEDMTSLIADVVRSKGAFL
jgi:shikimate kinase